MIEEQEFSLLGRDVWCVIGKHCGRLMQRMLDMTAKSFRDLLPAREQHFFADGEKFSDGALITTLATRANSFPLFRMFADSGAPTGIDTYIAAARRGNVEILQYLWQRQKFCEKQVEEICIASATANRHNVLDWLYSFMELEEFMVYNIAYQAATYGRVELLDWLECREVDFTTFKEKDKRVISNAAATRGNFETVLWFWRRGWRPLFAKRVASSHNLEMLHWMVKNNFLTKKDIVEGSVYLPYGRTSISRIINTIEEFQEPGTTYSPQVCMQAACLKSVPLLKWIRRQKFPWDSETTKEAAKRGSPEVLAYCLRKNCSADKDRLTSYAIKSNNVSTLTWLREQGYPWYDQTVLPLYAHPKLIQYLSENDYPLDLWKYSLNSFGGHTYDDEHDQKRHHNLMERIMNHVFAH